MLLKEEVEIIVVDGGSTDDSPTIIESNGNVKLIQTEKGRAIQMNAGAKAATANILYFFAL